MSSISSITSAGDIQADYMKILVAQLQNQNPLEPMNNNEMASQLAQLSQLGQIESLNNNFSEVLNTTKRSYADSLIGKNITFFSKDETTGDLEKITGKVTSVLNEPNTNEPMLTVTAAQGDQEQQYTLGLNAVVLVEN